MSISVSASRYHDISCGHRVVGHEGACRHIHGHNYRITFDCVAPYKDDIGRVIDFSIIKSKLCMWLEEVWDHRMLVWTEDPLRERLIEVDRESVILVPFNPTAENMAIYLLDTVCPLRLAGTSVTVSRVTVEETRKCSAIAELPR